MELCWGFVDVWVGAYVSRDLVPANPPKKPGHKTKNAPREEEEVRLAEGEAVRVPERQEGAKAGRDASLLLHLPLGPLPQVFPRVQQPRGELPDARPLERARLFLHGQHARARRVQHQRAHAHLYAWMPRGEPQSFCCCCCCCLNMSAPSQRTKLVPGASAPGAAWRGRPLVARWSSSDTPARRGGR